MGLEAWGRPVGVSLELHSPAGTAFSRRAPCVWPRPRPGTAASTSAEPVTPRGRPPSATSSGCEVGPRRWLLSHPRTCPVLQAFPGPLPEADLPAWSPLPGVPQPYPVIPTPCLTGTESPLLPPLSLSCPWCSGPGDMLFRGPLSAEGGAQQGPKAVGMWGL